jgi:HEAT repeat protein
MYLLSLVQAQVMTACLAISAVTLIPDILVASGPPSYEMGLRSMLRSLGEPADTPEDLEAALHSRFSPVRQFALLALSERRGESAVPTIRAYLGDENIDVRATAAGLLATFGDRSGLERMRGDFQSLLPPGGTPEEPGDPRELNLAHLQPALQVGRVLAELDDDRALTLALGALEHPLPVVRRYAVRVLGSIGRDGMERENGRTAFEALIGLVAPEQNRNVQVSLSTAARNMEPRAAIRLFEALSESEHVPAWLRQTSASNRAKKEADLQSAATRPAATKPADTSR